MAPSASEVAIVMVGQQHGKRDIIIKHRDNHLTRIMETHRAYDSLQYPLLLPRGEDGYNFDLRQSDQKTGQKTDKSVSCLNFYAFHLMVRGDNFNQILRFKEVTSQYFVDMYAKMEAERLRYLRSNQKQLRAELYSGLRDAINTDGNANNVGQRVILPSSFTGSPRYMNEQAQDAMSYVRKHGRPDLFITFTCNPKWEDIVDELFHGQTQYDRHDLTARVFHEKQKKLLWLLKDGKIFGDIACWMYTIEWQKRGLPHSHTLVWLKEKLHPDRIDSIITAELPDQELDPQLFHTISTQMVHGPCGHLNRRAPCMQDGKCIKRFPRPFLQDSQTGQDGYPLYRRRMPENGGQTCKLKKSMHQSSYSGTLIHLDSASIWPMHLGRFPNWSEVSTEVGLCQRGECPVAQEEPELMKSMHQSSYSGTLIHLDSATAPGWPLPAGAVPSCSIQSIDNTIIQKLMCML